MSGRSRRESARVVAYIDGFNLYHGSLKDTPALKWLDLGGLMDDLLRGQHVIKIKFFTARVKARPEDPSQVQRQDAYLRALEAHLGDRVEVHLGSFTQHKRWMPRVKKTPTGKQKFVQVWRTEEKGSDVNLGAHLVWDACHQEAEVAVVVSNDSDLQTPIDMARQAGLRVITVNPHLHNNQKASLFGDETRRLSLGRLGRNKLPDPVIEAGGRQINRPKDWA